MTGAAPPFPTFRNEEVTRRLGSDPRLRVAIHQPNYLPYFGFFHKMARSDWFVLYDTAQFSKNEFQNRNRIKTATGISWLTVPVERGSFRPIRSVRISSNTEWAEKHMRSLEANYRRAPFFASYEAELGAVLRRNWTFLAELNAALIGLISRWLSIDARILNASELPPPTTQDPTERLVEITRACKGEIYLSGTGGRRYLKEDAFSDVTLEYDDFRPKPYTQVFGAFVPNLSVVDAILNCGDAARGLLA